jgi:hypothetical protein
MVVWGEAVHGLSLRFLAERGAEIEKAAKARFGLTERVDRSLSIDELDAQGKSMLEAGPRALDLAQSRTSAAGTGLTLLRHTAGTFLAGELVCRALARRRSLLVVFTAGAGTGPFDGDGMLIGVPGKERDAIYAASHSALAADRLRELLLLFGLADAVAGRAADAILGFTAEANEGTPRVAVLSSAATANVSRAKLKEYLMHTPAAASPAWCAVTDFEGRQEVALRKGLMVDGETWQALGRYIQRTRVPTSERSRAQAG